MNWLDYWTFYNVGVGLFALAGVFLLVKWIFMKKGRKSSDPEIRFRHWREHFEQTEERLQDLLVQYPALPKEAAKLLRKLLPLGLGAAGGRHEFDAGNITQRPGMHARNCPNTDDCYPHVWPPLINYCRPDSVPASGQPYPRFSPIGGIGASLQSVKLGCPP